MRFSTSFGDWNQRTRKGLGLTQAMLAEIVGCATITIRKIEQDERKPSYELALRLAHALRIPEADQHAFLQVAVGNAAIHTLVGTLPSNLPPQLPALIGRHRELANATTQLLQNGTRLLTIVGPGGVGKTHLGHHIAAMVADHFADGPWVIDLAELTDPAQVALEIAQTIGCPVASPQLALSGLCTYLRDRSICLVLDHFDHLMGARPIVSAILKECFWTSILVTSRSPLHLQSERILRIAPLDTPPLDLPDLEREALLDYSGAALLVSRIQAVNPDFALTPSTIPAVVELCQYSDGLPLALEILAAYSGVFDPASMLPHLRRDILRLASHVIDSPARHRTLHAAIAWGYDLLTPAEQIAFARLALFEGEWTIEEADQLWRNTWFRDEGLVFSEGSGALSAMDGILALLDKGLIFQTASSSGIMRFCMLPLVRTFAREKFTRHHPQAHQTSIPANSQFIQQVSIVVNHRT